MGELLFVWFVCVCLGGRWRGFEGRGVSFSYRHADPHPHPYPSTPNTHSMQTNLVVYLTSILGQTPASASVAVMVFEGTCYLTPLLGAYLADAAWGRYRTILSFSCIYFAGLVALALSTVIPGLAPPALRGGDPTQPATLAQRFALYIPLYIVALGTGGIKPNVSAFGADQFDESDPADVADKKSFFNWFYLFVNVGSLLAVTTVVYVQDAVSWSVGFAIPAAAMAAAVGAFAAGAPRYRHVAPTESPMARVVRVLLAARKNAKAQSRAGGAARTEAAAAAAVSPARAAFSGPVNLPPSATPTAATLTRPPSYGWLSFAEDEYVPVSGSSAAGGFAGFSRAQVEEVRLVVRMAPIFWTTAFYWAIYAQMGSFFVEQGASMDRWTPAPWGGGARRVHRACRVARPVQHGCHHRSRPSLRQGPHPAAGKAWAQADPAAEDRVGAGAVRRRDGGGRGGGGRPPRRCPRRQDRARLPRPGGRGVGVLAGAAVSAGGGERGVDVDRAGGQEGREGVAERRRGFLFVCFHLTVFPSSQPHSSSSSTTKPPTSCAPAPWP